MATIQEQVIWDQTNDLYVMTWSEGNTVFLTDNLFEIERYKDAEHAISTFQQMKKAGCRFLRSSDNSEVKDVWLQVGILTISTKMNCRI